VFVSEAHPAPGGLLRDRWRETLPDVLDRVVLLPRLSPEDYFHLIAAASVCLDTLYFGGANTAYDAVAAGVPMVTLPTELPRGRYAAALLRLVGAEECIASTREEYVERAVALGTDRALRAAVGEQIRTHASLVFESTGAVAQLESFLSNALAPI
jgi:predicted O-linked N-acetylglucosamine transferase (SPINDLY family)